MVGTMTYDVCFCYCDIVKIGRTLSSVLPYPDKVCVIDHQGHEQVLPSGCLWVVDDPKNFYHKEMERQEKLEEDRKKKFAELKEEMSEHKRSEYIKELGEW